MDMIFYNNKIIELFKDSDTYLVVKKNSAMMIEKNLNMLKKCQKEFISDKELIEGVFDQVIPSCRRHMLYQKYIRKEFPLELLFFFNQHSSIFVSWFFARYYL